MKMSLKWKFILAFTLIPMIALGVFFVIIYNNFKADRLANIYETSLTQSRLLAKLTSERLTPIITMMEQWAEFYRRDSRYAETLLRTMRDSSTNLRVVSSAVLLEYKPFTNKIETASKLQWSTEGINIDHFSKNLEMFLRRLEKSPKPLITEELHSTDWTIIQKFKKDPTTDIIVLVSFNTKWVRGRFAGQIVTNNFWVGDLGQVLAKNTHLPNDIVPPVLKTIISGKSTYGSFFFKWKDQEYIVSYSVPNHTQIVMVNLIKAGVAYEALTLLLDKSLFLLFIFICLAAITGILLSKHLTSALETLVKATAAIGRGQFNIRLNIRTGDEIESLGKSVKKLATDIQGLLEETKDKGRMESELLLAKEVQATLFPPQAFDSDDITLRAFSKSASECGGDWWTYFETPTDFFVIVGDATGHGVPAALLTSATNALAQLLQTIKVHAPKEMLTFMNNALHQTAHGKKSITMSLIKINKTTGLVRYANASHESPFILRNLTTTTKLSELLSLDSQKSNPLGFAPDSEYDEGEFQLQANDALLLYTDGAIDARNMENQAWGERRFAKAVIEGLVNNSSLDRSMQHFVRSFDNHTNSAPLVDDVTVILVKYKNTDTPLY